MRTAFILMVLLLFATLFSSSGMNALPTAVPNEEALAIIVNKSNPIDNGYVCASEVNDSVKVVRVDGRAPWDAGYPLKLQG